MRIAGALVFVVLIAGCTAPGATSNASPVRTPLPSPSPVGTSTAGSSLAGDWAVMVHRAGEGEPYYVQLVSPDGRGGPWVEPVTRSAKLYYFPPTSCPPGGMCAGAETANYRLPETSISATRVYFLDADTVIRSLAPDGSVAVVKTIHAPPNSQVAFSVSPDDQRMAISIITLATDQSSQPVDVHMYVEDLAGGSNKVDLYSSTTLAEWPIGWHAGNLVLAVGSQDLGTYDNPYAARGYQVVDPGTGRRLASLDCAFGLLVAAGSACASGWCAVFEGPCDPGSLGEQTWDGTKTAFRPPAGPPAHIVRNGLVIHLSPDGIRLAADVVTNQQTGAAATMLFENGKAILIANDAAPKGWLDNTHLVVSSASEVDIVDVTTGTQRAVTDLKTIPQQGMPEFAGVMPANLG
jgi:hypothetical protein